MLPKSFAPLVSALLSACAPPTSAPRSAAPGPRASAPPLPSIVQAGDPVLRERARDVRRDEIGAPEMKALVARMIDAMRKAPGVGLAAPQVGESLRVIVMEDREELTKKLTPIELEERERAPFPVRVLFNPRLRAIGDEHAAFFEGCLSVRGYSALVDRAREVEVTALDENGSESVFRVRGWPARILQHEVDHLDGTLYVDRMQARTFGNADEIKARYGGRPIGEVRRMLGLEPSRMPEPLPTKGP